MQHRPDGVFTTALVVDARVHHLGLHVGRLVESAQIAGLAAPDTDAVRRAVAAVLADQPLPHARLRVAWDGADLTVTVEATEPRPPTTTALTAPDLRDPHAAAAGAKTEALSTQGRGLLAWAREHGAGDALLATNDGRLCEAATSNVFYVLDGELRTPTLDTGLLNGISRRLLVPATGAREMDAAYDVVRAASEVFLTSSLRGVQAVTAVDGAPVGDGTPGPFTRAARAAWDALPTDD